MVALDSDHAVMLAKKIIGNSLIEAKFTTDEHELVTFTKLGMEIEEALVAHQGRASVQQLQAVLGVEDVTCSAMRQLCTDNAEIRLVKLDGVVELVTETHLDSLAAKAVEIAVARGRVTVASLSSTLRVSDELAESLILPRILDRDERTVEIVNGALVADWYATLKKNEIRDACGMATGPQRVEDVLKSCNLRGEEADMVIALLQDLTQSGELAGSLTGGRVKEYVPDACLTAQREEADNFFATNGYLDNFTAQRLKIQNFHRVIKQSFPTAECLDSAVVSWEVVEQLDAVADEAVAQGSWFEAWSVLPTVLSDSDAGYLMGLCTSIKRAPGDPLRVLQLAEVYGASANFLKDLVDRYRMHIVSKLNTTAGECHRSESVPGEGATARQLNGKAGTRKRGKRDTKETHVLAEDVRSFVLSRVPEVGDYPPFASALGEHLLLPFRDVLEESMHRHREQRPHATGGAVHQLAGSFEARFEREYLSFQLYCRGLTALRQAPRHHSSVPESGADFAGSAVKCHAEGRPSCIESNSVEALETAEEFLLKTRGAGLAVLITDEECSKLGITFASQDSSDGRGSERMPVITEAARAALVELLPGRVGKSLASLWQAAMTGIGVASFCDVLEQQVLPACNLVRRRFDKRRERQLLADKHRESKQKLFRSVSERDVLYFGALLVFQHVKGAFPLLPQPAADSAMADDDDGDGRGFADLDWSRILLQTVRVDTAPEAHRALLDLQQDVQMVMESTNDTHSEKGQRSSSTDTGLIVPAEDFSVRLMRSTEAARAAALACGE